MKFTHQQYMYNECTHRQYYAQFVTENTKLRVKQVVGEAKIVASTDEHFNDIPLKTWDSVGSLQAVFGQLSECDDFLTFAGEVCINKEAAEQIREDYRHATIH